MKTRPRRSRTPQRMLPPPPPPRTHMEFYGTFDSNTFDNSTLWTMESPPPGMKLYTPHQGKLVHVRREYPYQQMPAGPSGSWPSIVYPSPGRHYPSYPQPQTQVNRKNGMKAKKEQRSSRPEEIAPMRRFPTEGALRPLSPSRKKIPSRKPSSQFNKKPRRDERRNEFLEGIKRDETERTTSPRKRREVEYPRETKRDNRRKKRDDGKPIAPSPCLNRAEGHDRAPVENQRKWFSRSPKEEQSRMSKRTIKSISQSNQQTTTVNNAAKDSKTESPWKWKFRGTKKNVDPPMKDSANTTQHKKEGNKSPKVYSKKVPAPKPFKKESDESPKTKRSTVKTKNENSSSGSKSRQVAQPEKRTAKSQGKEPSKQEHSNDQATGVYQPHLDYENIDEEREVEANRGRGKGPRGTRKEPDFIGFEKQKTRRPQRDNDDTTYDDGLTASSDSAMGITTLIEGLGLLDLLTGSATSGYGKERGRREDDQTSMFEGSDGDTLSLRQYTFKCGDYGGTTDKSSVSGNSEKGNSLFTDDSGSLVERMKILNLGHRGGLKRKVKKGNGRS